MLLRFMNILAGLIGYEWVRDNRPFNESDNNAPSHLISDEGWDDLHQYSPRYRLRRKR